LFGGYRLALAALALVVFGASDSYPYGGLTENHDLLLLIQRKITPKAQVTPNFIRGFTSFHRH